MNLPKNYAELILLMYLPSSCMGSKKLNKGRRRFFPEKSGRNKKTWFEKTFELFRNSSHLSKLLRKSMNSWIGGTYHCVLWLLIERQEPNTDNSNWQYNFAGLCPNLFFMWGVVLIINLIVLCDVCEAWTCGCGCGWVCVRVSMCMCVNVQMFESMSYKMLAWVRASVRMNVNLSE